MAHTILVPTETLAGRLADPDWLVVDCRFELSDPESGRRAYRASHIPGAIHADLERDLSSPVTAASGRHPLPPVAELEATFSRFGIAPGTQVVAYDEGPGAYAARLWWMLRWLGHDAVAVLDGGFAAWTGEGRAVAAAETAREPACFRARPREWMLCTTADIPGLLARGEALVDVRGAPRFRGEVEPLDTVAGHVPGAVNLPFLENLGPDGRLLAPAALAARFRERAGIVPGRPVTCMCGSGVTACQGLLALESAGVTGGRLYAGSWSEWIRDPSRPVARGPA